jgi:tetratricopeptide (TPR) repeat protein
MFASPSSAAAPSRWVLVGYAATLVLAALAAYHNTFRVPFLFDDTPAILDNPTIRHLGDLKDVLLPGAGYGITVSGRPILNLSLALCYAKSGTHVWSYHALNLLIHILAGLTLFGMVRRTLGLAGRVVPNPPLSVSNPSDRRVEDNAPYPADATPLAFTVALLWTLHPLQTEAVTYVIQRSESLMGLFFLLTFYCFIRAIESEPAMDEVFTTKIQSHGGKAADKKDSFVSWCLCGSRRTAAFWRVLAVLSCLLGVATKEVAATAPLLVFLYDRTFVAGTFREAWRRRRWLHLSLAATWVPLALLVAGTGWTRGGTAGFNVGVSPWAYWFTQFEAVACYLKQSLWPHPLIFEYGTFWLNFQEAAPFALIVVPLAAATVVAIVRRTVAGFLGAWFFAILAPTSLVPGTMQMIVEHRMYLPLAAVIAGAVVGLHAALSRLSKPAAAGVPPRCRSWVALSLPLLPGLALALPLGLLTEQRNGVYGDDLALWQQTVAQSPASALAQSSLGTALYLRHRLPEAMDHYLTSLRLNPNRALSHYNIALAYAALGHLPEAVAHCQEAVRINPRFSSAHYQLGLSLLLMNRPQEALAPFAEAVRLMPTMAEAHYEWGVALAKAGRLAEAVDRYQAALRLSPGLVDAENDLGAALFQLNRMPEAVACFQRVLRAKPDLAGAHFNLGLALARIGSTEQAIAQFTEAVRGRCAFRVPPDNVRPRL